MQFIRYSILVLRILSIILIFGHPVIGKCQLRESDLRNEWRLILEFRDNHISFLRQTTVEEGTILFMICDENDIVPVDCYQNKFNVTLPLPNCRQPLKIVLSKTNDVNCKPYNSYHVGFQLNCQSIAYFFESYKICFDNKHLRVVYSYNKAYPFVKVRPNHVRFDPDDIFPLNFFSAYNKREIYNRFTALLGTNQQYLGYNDNERHIDRGHMVPVADYMTNILMKSTFKMINVIPQFHSINAGNWNIIEEWARKLTNTPSRVCSGTFNIPLELPNTSGFYVPIYLHINRIPVPLWTYKIILNRNRERNVFLLYNNIHDPNVPNLPKNFCIPIPCPNTISLDKNNFRGYTFCCDPDHFMNTHVPHLYNYC